MKRGDANVWWIIIGAVIALVVVIVLLVMFTTKTSLLERGLGECKGGVCVGSESCPVNTLRTASFSCPTPDKPTCCIGSAKRCTGNNDCGEGEECPPSVGYCYPTGTVS